ncbi:MFS transporter [Corynebacterium alimapuense]|uniref:MFS transporter n=2 Tax=Corynebacterium alimapuense TaxID=1576874 RepID=A0A3M8KB57_9CORY|nr:MFS transporter [Corynebacterium alimapuense]
MWKAPGFIPTLIAVGAAFGSWALLLPVIPLAALEAGHSEALAGASTGVFMAATVITQVFTPKALRTFGYNPVMLFSAMMLGVPALGHLLGTEAWSILLFSALRGIGFGALTVSESALIAELVPVRFLGKATGMLGVFVGVSQMIGLPLGLALVNSLGYATVYFLAAGVALVAAIVCVWIPRIKAPPKTRSQDQQQDDGAQQSATWKLVLVPALAITSLSMSFGAVSSFLPAAVLELDAINGAVFGGLMLSVVGGAAMIARYLAGAIADYRGQPGATMIPAQIAGFIGVSLMALVLAQQWSVWWLLLAGLLFGGAFGMVQNEALLSMFHRLPRSKVSEASAVWNVFFDAGTGIGSFLLGAVAARAAYSGAFWVGSGIVLIGLAVTVLDRIVGEKRLHRYDNTRARLHRISSSQEPDSVANKQ